MYPNRRKHLDSRVEIFYSIPYKAGKVSVFLVWIFAIFLLVFSGIIYRALASRLKIVVETPVELPVPLSAFPIKIGNWIGKDVEIPANIVRVAHNDAFLNRLFRNEISNQWANVYIAYTAHPRTMLGHRPQICYVAGGWVHESSSKTTVMSNTDREVPCLLHRFHRPYPETEETVVLNFYIVNGRLTSDERVFSGVGFRTPNIDGDPARYVTQVQVSSVFEDSVRSATRDIVEKILDFFPDKEGKEKAIGYVEASSDIQDANAVQKIE